MTIADKILSIAKHEGKVDDDDWFFDVGGQLRHSHNTPYIFDPLNNWSDLMPLVVKYTLWMQTFESKHGVCWIADNNDLDDMISGKLNDLSESEYRRVAIEAIEAAIKELESCN